MTNNKTPVIFDHEALYDEKYAERIISLVKEMAADGLPSIIYVEYKQEGDEVWTDTTLDSAGMPSSDNFRNVMHYAEIGDPVKNFL